MENSYSNCTKINDPNLFVRFSVGFLNHISTKEEPSKSSMSVTVSMSVTESFESDADLMPSTTQPQRMYGSVYFLSLLHRFLYFFL